MKKEKLNIEERLECLKDEQILKVPENYFEDFASRLKLRISKEEIKPSVRLYWIDYYLKPALGIAAVFAILFLAVYTPVNKIFKEDKLNITYNNKSVKVNNAKSGNEQADLEVLMMIPQSQFLSALEDVETSNDATTIDPQALKDYLTENSIDYYLFTRN